ncbi:hypothetical protein [Rhodoflexus sp.]
MIKHVHTALLIVISAVVLYPAGGFSQVKKGSPARASTQKPAKDGASECIEALQEFAKAYSGIAEHRNKDKVLAFFTPNLATEITTINIRRNIQNRYSDYRQFSQYLDGIVNTRSLSVRYTIEKILHARTKGNFGVVVYEAAYEILRDGDMLIRGKEINTANMLKTGDRWLINYYTIYDIAANQQRGSCQCEIFKGEDGKYITRTSYPSGTRYEVMMDNFTISYNERLDARLVRVRDHYFVWKRNGSLMALTFDNGQFAEVGNELGITDDANEVLLIILRTALFSDNCLSVRKR